MAAATTRHAPRPSVFAWLGAGLFAASMGWFLFSYFIRFPALIPGQASAVTAVAWNVALFTLFAAHHSGAARDGVKRLAERVAPGRERTIYVWVASLLFAVVCAAWRAVPGTAWTIEGPAAWALRLVALAGVWLSIRSAAIIDVWELAGVRTPAASTEGAPDAEFVTRGPYGWVRHPIYAGWFLIVFPIPVMTMTQLVFAVVSGLYLIVGMMFEERSLLRAAPRSYAEYRRRVRWKVLPGVY